MSAILVALVILLLAAVSGYALYKRRRWGELIVSSLLWLFAAVYAYLVTSPVNLVNPTAVIIDFFGALFDRLTGSF